MCVTRRLYRFKLLWGNNLTVARRRGLPFPIARMGLAPLAHTLDVLGASKVAPSERRAPPAALAGPFPGLAAGGFPAVMLTVGVPVIGEEKLAATAALTSLRSQTHGESKPPLSQEKLKQNPRREEAPWRKKEEAIWREVAEENPRKKTEFQTGRFTPISFRR